MSETRTVSPTLEERLAGLLGEEFHIDIEHGFMAGFGPVEAARAILAAAKEHGLVIGEGELDAAWKEAEAALPEGWAIIRLEFLRTPARLVPFWQVVASAGQIYPNASGEGDTPTAALQALAAKLRDSRR